MVEEFRDNFENFMENFIEEFIDFFSSQCSGYDYSLEDEETKKLAREISANLLTQKIVISRDAQNTILKMKHDGVFIGFLLNKTLFYMFENYLVYLKNHELRQWEYPEKMVQFLGRFSYLFEKYIDKDISQKDEVISFADNNHIYLRNHILDIFQTIKEENRSVEFMNLYQGYSIRGDAKVISIDDGKIVFRVENELQEIAMKLEGKAYILKDKYFHRCVKADIVYCNFPNHTISLENFRYTANLLAAHRKNPRIYPDILVHAKLGGDKYEKHIAGNLYDLSQDGIGMISEENIDFYNGAKINVEFELIYNQKKHSVKTVGEIVNIMQHMDSYRYCLKIFPDEENLNLIVDYIREREEGIRKELRSELSM